MQWNLVVENQYHYMEYKEDRDSLKNWMVKMDANGKLEKFNKDYFTPPDIQNI